jgi:hypothetical protein
MSKAFRPKIRENLLEHMHDALNVKAKLDFENY